jgi:hypothetical protein
VEQRGARARADAQTLTGPSTAGHLFAHRADLLFLKLVTEVIVPIGSLTTMGGRTSAVTDLALIRHAIAIGANLDLACTRGCAVTTSRYRASICATWLVTGTERTHDRDPGLGDQLRPVARQVDFVEDVHQVGFDPREQGPKELRGGACRNSRADAGSGPGRVTGTAKRVNHSPGTRDSRTWRQSVTEGSALTTAVFQPRAPALLACSYASRGAPLHSAGGSACTR